MDGMPQKSSLRRYERDFLLQLRLHPFSLQKPKSLKDLEIVKDKLNLHQMENYYGSNGTSTSNFGSSYQGTVKADSDPMFRSHGFSQNCYPRSGPFYSASYKSNSGYHGVSSKSRPFYLPYTMNSARKYPVQTSPDYKFDLLDDIFSPNWPASQTAATGSKQSSYEELWNSYTRSMPKSVPKDQVPAKSKKTLPIIDPANGKNILEGIIKSPPTSQESFGENGSGATATDSEPLSSADEVAYEKTEDGEGLEIPGDRYAAEKVESDPETHVKDQAMGTSSGEPGQKELHPLKEIQGEDNIAMANGLNIAKEETSEGPAVDLTSKEQMSDYTKKTGYSTDEDVNDKTTDKESYGNCPMFYNSRNTFTSRDGVLRAEEQLKEKAALLKEKAYAMHQEHQKMVIYESFLRFRKHQLDEIVRSLDEQKVEIANWECNLVNKEKRLREREGWLEHQKKSLKNKEEELREKERKLNEISFELAEGISDKNLDKSPNSLSGSKLAKYINKLGEHRNSADAVEGFVASQSIGDQKRAGSLDKEHGEIVGRKFPRTVDSNENFANCNGIGNSPQNGVAYSEMNGERF